MQKLTVEQYKEVKQKFHEVYHYGEKGLYPEFNDYLKTISEEENVLVSIEYKVVQPGGSLNTRTSSFVLPKNEADILNNAGPYPELKAGNITIGTITKVEIIK